MEYAIGIDIGGTNTRVALIDEQYNMIKRIQFTTDTIDASVTLKRIAECIKGFGYQVKGIGVSCPGPLDLMEGIVLTPPNLPSWHHLAISNELTHLCGVPVVLENDANLACLAEATIGAGKDYKYVQFLTISTGIGAGFVVDKQIFHGARGFAQEIANCIFWKDGPQQGDLKKGSIESIASGTAISKRANEEGQHVTHAGVVFQLAQEGNVIAKDIMEDAYEYLSNLIATIYAILDPNVIILSGSVALKIDGFIEKIESLVKDKVYDVLKDHVVVVKAQLDEDCGLIGAAYLVFHKFA